MASNRKRPILLIELSDVVRKKLAAFLSRAEFDIREATDPAGAVRLLREENFDLVIIGYPLEALDLSSLLGAIRREGGPSRRAGVLLIGEGIPDPPPRGVNQVVSSARPDADVTEKAGLLLRVDPRTSVRILLKLEVSVHFGGTAEFVAQSVDISRSGVLIRTTRRAAIGEQVPISIQATGTAGSVDALAEVVRYADPSRENLTGFAVKFLEMDQLSRQRLDRILQGELESS